MTGRRPTSAPRPPMSDAHKAAIVIELTRLCLGGRPERSELIPTRSEIQQHFKLRRS